MNADSDAPIFILQRTNHGVVTTLEYVVRSTKKKYIITGTSEYTVDKIERILNGKRPNGVFTLLKKLDPKEILG